MFKPGDIVTGDSVRPYEVCEIIEDYPYAGKTGQYYRAKITNAEGYVAYRIIIAREMRLVGPKPTPRKRLVEVVEGGRKFLVLQ